MGRFPVITLSPGVAEAGAGVALSTADAEGQVTLMKTAEDLLIDESWVLFRDSDLCNKCAGKCAELKCEYWVGKSEWGSTSFWLQYIY